jgi:triosephosphate isomerase
MNKKHIKPPFFEIGPKSYLFGDQVFKLAMLAEKTAIKYDIDIIFTSPIIDIRRIAQATDRILLFAPHMDPISIGRGLADILPESLVAAGAHGVMLNHAEKPISISVLDKTITRAKEVGLMTIVCADSIAQAKSVACLNPDIIIAEPTDLIGTDQTSDMDYIKATINTVKSINSNILVLQAAGIRSGKNVFDVILAGAEATGSSSGIICAPSPETMIDEMISSLKEAWTIHNKY